MRGTDIKLLILLGGLLFLTTFLNAQTCTWIASGATANWNNPTNWSCGVVPTTTHDVVFDATSTTNCIINVKVDVNSISVNAGYTGTITNTTFPIYTLAFTQSDGTFDAGSDSLYVNGPWVLNAGSFIAPSDIMVVRGGPFDHQGGTFDNNGGTVHLVDLSSCPPDFVFNSVDTFSTLIFDVTGFPSCGFRYDMAGDTIVVLDTLKTVGNSLLRLNNGVIVVKNDIVTQHSGTNGDAVILINGSGGQNWTGPSNEPCGKGMLSNVIIDKAPLDTLYIYEHPTITGTYLYVSGVIKTIGTLCFQGFATLSGPSHTISDVEFMRNTITLDPGLVITSDSSCAIYLAAPNLNRGEIHVKGDLVSYCWVSAGGGSTNLRINGTGKQTLYTNSLIGNSGFPNVFIEKAPTDSLLIVRSPSPYHNIGPQPTSENKYAGTNSDWTYVGGLIGGDGIIAFSNRNSLFTTNVTGSHNIPNVSFVSNLIATTLKTIITTGTVLTVDDSMFTDGVGRVDIDNGRVDVKGNILLNNEGIGADGTATIRLIGTGTQTFGSSITLGESRLPNIIIEKPSGTVVLKDTVTITGNWTYLSGLVDATSFNSVFAFSTTGKTIDAENSGYVHSFNELALRNGFDRTLLGSVGIERALTLGAGDIILNRNRMTIKNPATTAITRTTGKILSEDQAPGNYGVVEWNIGNAAPGSRYVFPFVSATNDSIPFEFEVTAAGSGSGGSIAVSTYRTDWTLFPNNRPLPNGVTNIDNVLTVDNYQREIDRFWMIDANNYTTAPTSTLGFSYAQSEWINARNVINEDILEVHRWLPGTSAWSLPTIGNSTQDTTRNRVSIPGQDTYTVFTLVDPNPPDLIISSSDTIVCVGATVDFFDENIVTPTSSAWQFQGGTPSTSNQIDPTGIVYNTPGTYDVILWATFPGGVIRDTFPDFITVVSSPSVVLDSQNVLCAGGGNAAIWATPTPSVVDTFLWSGGTSGVTPDTIVGLVTGAYTVTVVDTNGCTATATTTVSAPTALVVAKDSVNVTCNGGADGKAWVTITGGTTPYNNVVWSSGTPSGPINDTISGLTSGTYTATITDANSCQQIVTFVIEEPAAGVTVVLDSTSVSCNGGSDGTAWATPSGGTPPYDYTWSAGTPTNATGDTTAGLSAGSYTVTVEDDNGCSVIGSFTIGEPDALVLDLDTIGVSCFGGADGIAWVTVTGGTPGYTYAWNSGTPVGAGDTVVGLVAGTCIVTVTDNNGCIAIDSIPVTEPTDIVLSLDSTDVNCFGGADGKAWVTATGGTPNYTYAWNGGTPTNATGDTIGGLTAGFYTVTVTDDNGCTKVDSVEVIEPTSPLAIAKDSVGVTCFGGADGKAWVTPSGGTPGYTITWSSGTTSGPIDDTISGLTGGTYFVTVTDSRGCTDSTSIIISAPTAGITIVKDSNNVSCFGGADGKAWFTPSGGTTPYTITWSAGTPSGPINDTISGLTAGTYVGTVTDFNGCTAVDSFVISEPTALTLDLDSTDVLCNGDATGTAWATVGGGTSSYTYTWSGGTPTNATGDTIGGLVAGTYIVTVTDANSCTIVDSIVVNEPTLVVLDLDSTDISCFGANDGKAWVTANGGTSGYTYVWSGGTPTNATGDTIGGLAPGTYIVTVTDANSCISVDSIVVNEPTLLTIALDSTDITCNGGADGTAWVTATGGTSPYSYAWSGGTPTNATGDTIGGLSAGTYIVTVTDDNGCTAVDSISINDPAPIGTTVDQTNVSCGGGADGRAWVTATGGTPAYTYNWSGGTPTNATGDTVAGLSVGTYYVSVTDLNSCLVVDSVIITEPVPIVLDLDSIDVLCFGDTTGVAWVTATGGTSPYTYSWNAGTPGVTNDTIINLAAGTYVVTVSDFNGCVKVDSIVVNEPTLLTTTTDSTDVSCFGGADGTAWVTVAGGTPTYTYNWSGGTPGVTDDTIVGLTAGTYFVTVTDNNGCTTEDSIVVNEPTLLVVDLDSTDITCNGGADGTAWVTATGGTPAYSYAWSGGTPGLTNDTIVGLTAGTYIVTVTDDNGCTAVDSIVINEPAAIVLDLDSVDVLCNGDNTGSAWVTVTGGTNPLSYAWSGGTPGVTNDTIVDLVAGTYIVTVTDLNGCQAVDSIVVNEPSLITLDLDSTDVLCNGDATGTAWVTATGGTPGYTYAWSGGTPGLTNDTIVGLVAGTYIVTVTDLNGCESIDSIVVNEPTPLVTTMDSIDISCNGGADGLIWVTVTGGTPGYTYAWSGGTPTNATGDTIGGLVAGTYTVTVTDANGCTIVDSASVNEPAALGLVMDGLDISCFGGADGRAWGTVTGGTPGYTYVWSGGTPTPGAGDTITGLTAGRYILTVTDNNGCEIIDSIDLTEPTAITLDLDSIDVLCNGDTNGVAWVTVTGGTGPYTYSWNGGTPGVTTDTIVNLPAGTYAVTISDFNGCTAVDSIVVNEPSLITLDLDSTDVLCNGDATGTAWVTATGGTPGYTYAWSGGTPGLTNDTIVGLVAGTYIVTVTDQNGCESIDSIVVNEPTPLVTTMDSTNVSCNAGADGKIWVTVTGGTPTYTYAWSGGTPTNATGDTIGGLVAGTYFVTVTDNNGCTIVDSATVTEPAALGLVMDGLDISCFGGADGRAWGTVTGGTPGYTYVWSGGTPTPGVGDTITGLTAGRYILTVTDDNGCEIIDSIDLVEPTAITLDLDSIDVLCNGDTNGVAWVTVAGGTGPYTYSWNGGTPGVTNDTIVNLPAGTYAVTISDFNGCTAVDSIVVNEPSLITLDLDSTDVLCNGDATGTAWVTATGGTPGYTYAWSGGTPGITNDTIVGLVAGTYIVTVTDQNGCESIDSIVVNEPTPLVTTMDSTNVSCNAGADGKIWVTVTGGTPTYTYAWSGGTPTNATGDTIGGLVAGTYFVTVTDGNGCTIVDSATVTEPAALGLVMDGTDISCNAGADGTAWGTVTGGTPGYTYNWSGGTPTNATGDTIAGLTAGWYILTVTDTNGCAIVDSIELTEPTPIVLTMDSTNILCNGDTNGVVYVTATGGTPGAGYNYAWSGGTPSNATGDTIINLAAGTYVVTVTDANGCEAIDSAMVVEPPALVLDLDSTDVNCFGGSDGTAWATASGGTGTLVYTWSGGTPGLTTDTIVGLVAGTYTVTITDDNNCSIVDSIVVNEPSAPLTLTTDSTDVNCFGGADGTAWVTAVGGTSPYSYAWSGGTPGLTDDTIVGLVAGTYFVTVTDDNGCTETDSIVVNEPTQLVIVMDSTNVSCNGGNDGAAWVTATGGTPGAGYTYTWSGGTPGTTTDTVVLLTAGTYIVTVTDANGCEAIDSVLIEEPTPINILPDSTNVSCFGGADGKAWVTVSGGTPATAGYNITWSGGTPTGPQNDTITGLIAGAYTAVVTDSNGCADSVTINITEPALLVIDLDSTDVNCLGGNDGSAWVSVTGGTPGYDYAWSGGTPNTVGDSITDLVAGTYIVTVTDTNGCVAVDSIVVNEPATAISFVKDSTNVNCFGGADGTAWVTATGGTPSTVGPAGYTYTWSGGGTVGGGAGDTLVGLTAGMYYVTVTDANGCELADSFMITEPLAPLAVVKDSLNVACNGDNTGRAWVTVTGGTPGYDYAWSGGTPTGAGDTIIDLIAGTYRVTVTDTNSCTITALFTIVEPTAITTTIDQDNVNCFGGSDGKAWITGGGGVTPYTYAWSGGVTVSTDGDTALNLSAGTYYVTLTDDNGCTAIDSAVITEPAAPLTLVSDSIDVNCFGGADGKAWVTASGGTPLYSYTWTGGTQIGDGDTIIDLTSGSYTVTVTDANSCTEVITIVVNQPAAPLTSTIDAENVSCFGAGDGSAWVTPAGGTAGYVYAWSGGTPSANGDTVTGLIPGNYIVTITDANGCTVTDAIGITEPDELLLTMVVDSNTNCYGGATGGATVSLTGGTGPYDYEWSNGAGSTLASTDTFNSVASLMIGDYIVTVTDANGCVTQDTVNIIERPGPQYVDALIVSTLCNEPNGSISLDFTTSDPPLSYEWSHDATLNAPTANNLVDGLYTVTITDGSACDTVIQDIYVPAVDKPVLDTAIVKQSFCGNEDGAITVVFSSGVPPYNYTWSHDSTLNNATAADLEPGQYQVTVADDNACDTIMSFTIVDLDAPDLTVDPLPVQTIFSGQTLSIEASLVTPLDTVTYEWSPLDEINCSDCLDPLLSPSQTTTFLLVATDANTGCTDTLFYTVVVKDEENIFVPNAFTPNGDGVNDVWNIRDLEFFPNNELIILNRWGDEVFRAAPYLNDWNGTYNGANLPAGTYYYILKLDDIDEATTGPLTIIK